MTTTQTTQGQHASTPLIEDQIGEYRRNQRRLFNVQQVTRRLGRVLTGRSTLQQTLEQQMDPQAQLKLSMQERAAIAPAEVLYHSRRDDNHLRVFSSINILASSRHHHGACKLPTSSKLRRTKLKTNF